MSILKRLRAKKQKITGPAFSLFLLCSRVAVSLGFFGPGSAELRSVQIVMIGDLTAQLGWIFGSKRHPPYQPLAVSQVPDKESVLVVLVLILVVVIC